MHGHRFVLLLSAALAAGPGMAQGGGDPLDSAACRRALDALRTQEDQAPAGATGPERRQTAARLEPLRRAAARACLGGRGDPPSAQRPAQPPAEVPRIALPGAAVPAPAAPPPPVARPPAPPVVVTTCDAAGCWASDGSRLQRFGTQFMGPRGPCSVQGVVLNCP